LGITGASAVVAFKSGLVYRIASMNPWINLLVFGGGTIGTMIATQAINPENKIAKQAAFVAMNSIMGVSLCTLGFFHPQILVKAGLYTAAMFGGLSFAAMNAREERFLYMGGPLMAGLCVLIVASLSSLLLPARYARALSILDALVLYGGLALFGAFILYDTQKLMLRAKQYEQIKSDYIVQAGPNARIPQPDYIGQSISLYLDFINIFIRMVMILANSNSRKR
jgi:FtsH-binding integral membrane protein